MSRVLSKATEAQIATGHVLLAQIKAMTLLQIGEYRQAFEAANIATATARRKGFVGVMGPSAFNVCSSPLLT